MVFLSFSILIHEMGHCLAAAHCGRESLEIILWPLGGLARMALSGRTHADRVYILFSGPATHILQSVVWVGFLLILFGTPFPGISTGQAAKDNSNDFDTTSGFVWFWLEVFMRNQVSFCASWL